MTTDKYLDIITPLGEDKFILTGLEGTEKIGEFSFNLSLTSSDKNIAPDSIIGKNITISLKVRDNDQPRYFNGIVMRFHADQYIDGVQHYHMHLTSWFALLDFATDCRIFQNKDVSEIAETLIKEFGLGDIDVKNLKKNYAKREYCVQYKETTKHFILRLLQEEGIFYYFKHDKHQHTLVLHDDSDDLNAIDEVVTIDQGNLKTRCLTRFIRNNSFYTGEHVFRAFHFEKPNDKLEASSSVGTKLAMAAGFTHYDYEPDRYHETSFGEEDAKQSFEAHEVNYEVYSGDGSFDSFTAGKRFKLKLEKEEKVYLLTNVSHNATMRANTNGYGEVVYRNNFECIPGDTKYREHVPAKRKIYGPLTAIVVGPKDAEQYIDTFGRIRVQFQWDRLGEFNEKSTCWLRVAQVIAGSGWGAQFLPRIGHEVIVHFIHGDPDSPVVIGTLYNGNNRPPYSLPENKTQSGFKMHSTKDGGNESNELRFDDNKGAEEIYIHAQKDLKINVENDQSIEIVNGNYSLAVKAGECTIEAAKSIVLKVGGTSLTMTPADMVMLSNLIKQNT